MAASTASSTVPAILHAADIHDTEGARADLYGLLARLWFAPPDAALLARVHAVARSAPPAPQTDGFLAMPWRGLVDRLRATSAAEAAEEFDALFVSVGKPEILAYGSQYLAGALNQTPLVRLRSNLAVLGLARDPARGETEDHIAFEFEVMRWLISGDDLAVCNLEQQRRFFRQHLQTWVEALCDSVIDHPSARVMRDVAVLTRAFVQLEAQAFDMIE